LTPEEAIAAARTGNRSALGLPAPAAPSTATVPAPALELGAPEAPAAPAPAPASAPLDPAIAVAKARAQAQADASSAADFEAWRVLQKDLSPEKGVDVAIVQQATGLPPDYVAEHLDELKKDLAQEQLKDAILDSPSVRRLLNDPSLAGHVKDQLDDVSTWEWLFGRWDRVPTKEWDPIVGAYQHKIRGPQSMDAAPAWMQAARGGWAETYQIPLLAAKVLAGEGTPEDEAELERLEKTYGGRTYGAHNPATKALVGAPKMLPYIVGSALSRLAGGAIGTGIGGGGGAAAGAPAAGVGAAPGAAVGGIGGAAVGQYIGGAAFDFFENVGPMYLTLRRLKDGNGDPLLDDDEARGYAVASSAGLALLTSGIGGKVAQNVPWLKDVLKKQVQRGATEAFVKAGSREAIARATKTYGKHVLSGALLMATQNAGNAATVELARQAHGQDADWLNVALAAKSGALAGLQDMLLVAAWTPGREFLRDRGLAAAGDADLARYDLIGEHAAKSPVLEDAPAGERILGEVALAQGPAPVFADPVGWDSYWTKRADPHGGTFNPREIAAEIAGDGGAQYDRVKAGLEADLAFPLAKWAAKFKGTTHHAGLREDVKMQGETRTPRQRKAWGQQLERLQKAAEGKGADEAALELDGLEHAKYLEVLQAKPDLGEAHAASVARIYRDAIAFFAAKARISPADVAREFPIPIHAPEAAAPALKLTPDRTPPAAPPRAPAEPSAQGTLLDASRRVEAAGGVREAGGKGDRPAEPKQGGQAAAPADLSDLIRATYRGDKRAIAQLARLARAKPAAQADVEPLTGLGGRAAYDAARAERRGGVWIQHDLNHLKKINDRLGHGPGGDAALRAIGQTVGALAKAHGGEAFRWGGDELATWVPSEAAARAWEGDAATALAGLPELESGARRHKLSLSSGFGATPEAADVALYRAKDEAAAAGRGGSLERVDARLAEIGTELQGETADRPALEKERGQLQAQRARIEQGAKAPDMTRHSFTAWEAMGDVQPASQIDRGAAPADTTAAAGRAFAFLRTGKGAELQDLARTSKEAAAAEGKGEVPGEIRKELEGVQREIAQLEAGRAKARAAGELAADESLTAAGKKVRAADAARIAKDPVRRPSTTRRVHLVQVDDPEGGKVWRPLGAEEVPAGARVRPVELPDWLDPERFLEERGSWEWTWSALEAGQAAPEQAQKLVQAYMRRALESFPPNEWGIFQGYAVARLLSGKGGRFYAGLREKLEAWMREPEGARAEDPMPEVAWGKLIDTTRKDTEFVSAGRFTNKKRVDTLRAWYRATTAELNPDRPTYEARPPRFAGKAITVEEARRAEAAPADPAEARLQELRAKALELEGRAREARIASAPARPKLDAQAVIDVVGADALTAFRGLLAEQGGIHPDELAKRLGLEDGVQLLAAMAEAHREKTGEAAIAALDQGAAVLTQPAFHGTPFRGIDRFSTSRVGSGEGVAAQEKARRDAIAAAADKHGLLWQEGRGRVVFRVPGSPGEGATLDLSLLANADHSTAAHEIGHWMGLVLGQLANRAGADRELVTLYRTALDAMGYQDHDERIRSLLEIQDLRRREALGETLSKGDLDRRRELEAREEKLSHSFELHLAEGKAPTAELARTFSRFKLWMIRIYRGLEGVRETYRKAYGRELDLSDDVRRMFDRILGARDAVAEAERDAGGAELEAAVRAAYEPKDADELLRQTAEARREAEDQLHKVLLAEDGRERQVFFARERERIAAEVGKELDQEKGYQVQAFLREGKVPEGMQLPPELVTDAGEVRMLDRDEAIARYGAAWVRQNLRGMTSTGDRAVPMDVLAEAFHFATGDELVREVAKIPSRREVVRARTQAKLEELYGPALLENPEKLAGEALDAAHNEAKARSILTGMRLLARRLYPELDPRYRAIDLPELRQRALDFQRERPLYEVQPGRALQAERASAKQAIDLLAKAAKAKDEGTRRQLAAAAFDAHEAQLFNHYLWRAAKELRENAEKDLGALRQATGPRAWAKLGKAGTDYQERVADLVDAIELRTSRSRAEVERRREILYASGGEPKAAAAMLAWLEKQKALNRDPFVPDRVIDTLKKIRHWSELSPEEIGELRDSVDSILHLATVKDTLLTTKGRRERKAVIGELGQRLFETFGDNGIVVDRNTLAFKKRALRAVRRLKAGVIRPEEFFREADGGDLNGPFTKYLWNTVSDAAHRWSDLAEKVAKPVVEELERMPAAEKARWKELRFTVKGQPYTMEAALAVALNWGNLSNRSKIVRGWQYGGLEKFGLQAWDGEATAHEFLRHLTAKDWQLVQAIWDRLETLWPEMSELERRMTGLVPPKVKREAFTVRTSDGQDVTLQGGYYPMVYDRRFSHAGAAQGEKDDVGSFQLFDRNAERAITPHGHLNARIEEFARPVELSLIGLQRHLAHATKDIAMREALISAYEIVTDSQFRAAIQRTAGEEVLPLLDKWIRDTANDLVIPDGGEGQWVQFNQTMRSGLTGSVFAFNAAQALQNLTGAANVLDRVDARYLWKGIERLMAERGAMVEWVKRTSSEMRHSSRNIDRDISQGLQRTLGKKGALYRSKEIAMWGFQASDAVVRYAAWLGAYYQAKDGKVEGVRPTEKEAIRWADQTVRLSLTAAMTKDLPALMRSPHAKWFTLFAGWANSRLNRLIAATADAKRDVRDRQTGRALRKLTRITFWFLAGAVLSDLAVGKGAQDFDDDGEIDGADWARWLARRASLAPLSVIPLAGQVARSVWDDRRDVQLAPVERVYSGVARAASSLASAGSKWLEGDGEWTSELADFGTSAAEAAAMSTGLPVSQVKASLGYWLDENRDPDDTLGEAALGSTFGKKRKGSLSTALYGD
jgi:GGDEF domain-containing protein